MPRTKDLTKIRDEYTGVLSNGEAAWTDAAASARRKTVAEDIFLRMVVAWEEFISDWFIAAVNHDASEFKATMERKLREWQEQAVQGSAYSHYANAFRAPVLTIGRNRSSPRFISFSTRGRRTSSSAHLKSSSEEALTPT